MKRNNKNKKISKLKKNAFELWKNYINDAFSYIKESRNYVYSIMGLFIFFVIIGFFIIPLNTEISSLINEAIEEILLKTTSLSGLELMLFIFINNLTVSFYGIFLGFFFGVFPILNSIVNGSVIGYVFAKVYGVTGGISSFWMIFPHGVFELPAVFISLGLGVRFGTFMFSKNALSELKHRFIGSIKVFFFVIMPLLVLAAIIEGVLITFFK